MDTRFTVTDAPRIVSDLPADLSLTTMAWRALQADHEQRARQEAEYDSQIHALREALVSVADQAVGLRQQAVALTAGRTAAPTGEQLLYLADVLLETLSRAGMIVVSPEGQEYGGDLLEMMENCAQIVDPAATAPKVAQVLAPAILQEGRIVRMGKVVVAVPARPQACRPTEADP